jgi:hypothetical protein
MSHNARIRASWPLFTLLTSAYMELFDQRQFESVNGDAGGTWAPSARIVIGGLGIWVTGLAQLDNADIQIGTGKKLRVLSGATFITDAGSTTTLNGAGTLNATWTMSGTGRLIVLANGIITINSGATVDCNGTLNANGVNNLGEDSVTTNYGTFVSEAGSFISTAVGCQVTLNGTTIANGAVTTNALVTVNAGFTLGTSAVGTWRGTHTLKSNFVLTSEAGSDLTFAGAKFNGPIERVGIGGYDLWRNYPLPAPAMAGTTVTIFAAAHDRYLLDLSTNAGVAYSLDNASTPDDIRIMFVRKSLDGSTAGAQILANGGAVIFHFNAKVGGTGWDHPTSCVLYKSDGVWMVDAWSGVFTVADDNSNSVDFT